MDFFFGEIMESGKNLGKKGSDMDKTIWVKLAWFSPTHSLIQWVCIDCHFSIFKTIKVITAIKRERNNNDS